MSKPESKSDCKPICAVSSQPPDLKHVKPEDRKKYRQQQIQEWLDQMLVRAPRECFGHYIGRVHAVASHELKFDHAARYCVGDEFPHFLDRYVWRILQGARLSMIKHGVIIQPEVEKQYFALLREEVEQLFNDDQIIPDPRQKMLPGDTWVHEGEHCASSRTARECMKDYEPEHVAGFHEAKCDGAAGKNFQSF
ncbi:hypothetical protein KC19_4G075100 [Ceratodon purpureus]|uniref:Uncharacterized protein n=1 Tax=Ceratodon purpureus TaxID=3225 RepID=A0A8T0I9I1_CERPU|nr:hypothetical protein KC19_4G075100 [Ceratodon purpureus]